MATWYVSLTKDFIGCYLEFEAESEQAVRQYLADEYRRGSEWKLPWCAVYPAIPAIDQSRAIIIKAKCGPLFFDVRRAVTQCREDRLTA